MVVALEDLHWADASTLDLLAFLAHGVGRARVLLLAPTARKRSASASRCSDSCPRRSALAPRCLWSSSRSGATTSKRSSARAARTRPPEALVDTIFAALRNPLFAKELLAATTRDAALPPVLRDMLLADVARLDTSSRAVLRVAAAARGTHPANCSRGVTVGRACARRGAAAGGRARPVRAGPGGGTFRFRHALFAEAVYAPPRASARCCTSASPVRSRRSHGSR